MKYILILLWTDIVIAVASSISAVAALGALLYAWKGFRILIEQLKELTRQNDLNEEKMSRVYRPKLDVQKESAGSRQFEINYMILNTGMPAYEFKLSINSSSEDLGSKDVFNKGEVFKFPISHKGKPVEYKGKVGDGIEAYELTMTYMDQIGQWYTQKVKVGPGNDHFDFTPKNFLPEPIEENDYPLRDRL